MGNNIRQKIAENIEEMKNLIASFDYKKAKVIYIQIRDELNKIEKDSLISEIQKFLLNNYTPKNLLFDFETLITNIKSRDKLAYLFQLIYENELLESISDKKLANPNSKIIQKIKTNKSIEEQKKDINIEMKRIVVVNNYIEFIRFKSIMFERIAEKYFVLGSIIYNSFDEKQNKSSTELQEVINIFTECIKNYKNTENQKKKLQDYSNALERAKAHQNILLGKEKLYEGKHEEALNHFKNANYNNSSISDERQRGILLCYEKLAEKEVENNNFEKAIEYYKYLNNYLKIYELKIKINENKIIEKIKEKKFDETFEYFNSIFDALNRVKDRDLIELKFNDLFIIFLELIIKLAIISYQQNDLGSYIKTLINLKDNIDNVDINFKVDELISELQNLEKDNKNIFFEHIKNTLNVNNSEIKHRFYLSFIIIRYLNEQPSETLALLLKRGIKLSYLNSESFNILKEFFIKKNNADDLFLISKLFHKIIVNAGIFNRIEILNIIGSKILEILKIPNIEKDNKYFDIIDYLVTSFQEIMINNPKIDKYIGPKKILCSVLFKFNKYVYSISKGLLFLSTKEIKFENKIIDIIVAYLLQNENDNLLQTLMIQSELEPKTTIQLLPRIYNILFNYQSIQMNKKYEKIEKIFNFLLSLPEEVISSRESINFLEIYTNETDIHPLCFKLIRKIPMRNRTIKLTQRLENENKNKNKRYIKLNKEDMKNQFNFMSIISKEDLPELEINLDDQFYVDKLLFYLKNQKSLLNHLNLEEICKHFSPLTKELFNLLIENEIKFNEKALLNLLKGFYKNSEEELNETFAIFKKIKQYQGDFPLIIETNLKIEEFLNKKLYEDIKSFDIKLSEIFNDLSYLNGFANQHKKFILYILKVTSNEKKQELLNNITKFLVEKYYDIGVDIYKEIIKNIYLDEFIKIIPIVLSTKQISEKIKKLTLIKLYVMLRETDDKIKLLKSFKLFVDFIILPDKILEYLISLIKENNNPEIYNETIFFLGNYFSTKIKQEKYLNILEAIISKDEIYIYITNNIKSIKSKKEILYLYGCLKYHNFVEAAQEEKDILKIPINNIVDIIATLNEQFDKDLFYQNLSYLNNYYHYEDFSTRRDKIVRKLYFNNKKNAINKLKLICC